MAPVLRSARVRRIIAAFTINRLGGWFGLVALMVLVFDHTHSALAVSALLLAWQAVPAFAVPPLVARVEASVHGRELSGLYFFEAIATAGLAFFAAHFWLPAVLVLAALDGIAALSAAALLRAELARAAREHALTGTPKGSDTSIVEGSDAAAIATDNGPNKRVGTDGDLGDEAEASANAALNVAFAATFVAGPILGGIAVATAGAPAALLIDVGSFVLCGALLLDLHPHVEEAAGESVRARLRAAWLHIADKPRIKTLLLVYAGALALFQTAGPIEVTFVKETLHAGDRGLGALFTFWGGGAVLGSIVFARLNARPPALMLSAGTLAIGLASVGFALAPTIGIACAVAVVGGLGNGVELPALMRLVQQISPSDMHGRLMAAVESLSAFAIALGLLVGGALVVLSSTRVAFAIVAAATILTSALLLWLGRRSEEDATSERSVPVNDTFVAQPSLLSVPARATMDDTRDGP